jgi:hypothetical protein
MPPEAPPQTSPIIAKPSNTLLIGAAVLILLALIGVAAYAYSRGNGYVPQSQAMATTTTENASYALLYADIDQFKNGPYSDSFGYKTSLTVVDPATREKQSVGSTNVNLDIDDLGIIGGTSPDAHEFYYVEKTNAYRNTIVKSNLDGTATSSKLVIQQKLWAFAVSPDGRYVAWCSGSQGLSVYDFTNDTTHTLPNPSPCDSKYAQLSFSRDDGRVYYTGDGFRMFDLATGKDTQINPSETLNTKYVLWDDPLVNLAAHVMLSPKTDTAGNASGYDVKRLSDISFDYLTPEQINALPTIATFTVDNPLDIVLSSDGTGAFYSKQEKLGYFDFPTQVNTFPIANVPVEGRPRAIAAVNKDALFYTAQKELGNYKDTGDDKYGKYVHYADELHMTTVTGDDALLTSKTSGDIDFIGIVRQ